MGQSEQWAPLDGQYLAGGGTGPDPQVRCRHSLTPHPKYTCGCKAGANTTGSCEERDFLSKKSQILEDPLSLEVNIEKEEKNS